MRRWSGAGGRGGGPWMGWARRLVRRPRRSLRLHRFSWVRRTTGPAGRPLGGGRGLLRRPGGRGPTPHASRPTTGGEGSSWSLIAAATVRELIRLRRAGPGRAGLRCGRERQSAGGAFPRRRGRDCGELGGGTRARGAGFVGALPLRIGRPADRAGAGGCARLCGHSAPRHVYSRHEGDGGGGAAAARLAAGFRVGRRRRRGGGFVGGGLEVAFA